VINVEIAGEAVQLWLGPDAVAELIDALARLQELRESGHYAEPDPFYGD
jgi:hypothetical protein